MKLASRARCRQSGFVRGGFVWAGLLWQPGEAALSRSTWNFFCIAAFTTLDVGWRAAGPGFGRHQRVRRIMKIEDLPRPWFLAAVTGVPMSDLLTRAEQEHTEEPQAVRNASRDRPRSRPPTESGRPGAARRVRADASLAS